MNAVRRALAVTGLAVALAVGTAVPAAATYADSAAVSTSVATGTVAAPASVAVDDWCITTTVTTTRTVHTDPVTGAQTQTAWSRTSIDSASSINVNSDTSTSVSGPGLNETTTTRIQQDTELYVSATWQASGSRGVTGYAVAAHLSDGSAFIMATTAGTSMSGHEDADARRYSPRLSVTTLTSYNWTATSALTRVLSC
ncbi:hypothetical protein QOZ88_06545 [Blastococcus sp. BMG 814]|uniref:Uncharacterized protein n=1 Tax=Blastococcus carthaginiensis TaxID=3050034 RepID=A0ABT9I9P5_9ACTN|nr:hypothetical protein [Blastococcus carthaginiensis]MDP5182291.1 hypothetical protein [Blastococcus carthaginiensis]